MTLFIVETSTYLRDNNNHRIVLTALHDFTYINSIRPIDCMLRQMIHKNTILSDNDKLKKQFTLSILDHE